MIVQKITQLLKYIYWVSRTLTALWLCHMVVLRTASPSPENCSLPYSANEHHHYINTRYPELLSRLEVLMIHSYGLLSKGRREFVLLLQVISCTHTHTHTLAAATASTLRFSLTPCYFLDTYQLPSWIWQNFPATGISKGVSCLACLLMQWTCRQMFESSSIPQNIPFGGLISDWVRDQLLL